MRNRCRRRSGSGSRCGSRRSRLHCRNSTCPRRDRFQNSSQFVHSIAQRRNKCGNSMKRTQIIGNLACWFGLIAHKGNDLLSVVPSKSNLACHLIRCQRVTGSHQHQGIGSTDGANDLRFIRSTAAKLLCTDPTGQSVAFAQFSNDSVSQIIILEGKADKRIVFDSIHKYTSYCAIKSF